MTDNSRIRLRVRPSPEAYGRGFRIQIDSDSGWTSGQLDLDATKSVNDIPVAKRGDNHFRAVLFDNAGAPVPSGETRFVVKRVDATSSGTPLTHTIAVKVVEGATGAERNTLEDLIEKGHALPASGVKEFRAARDLRSTDSGYIDFEVYQREDGVFDPKCKRRSENPSRSGRMVGRTGVKIRQAQALCLIRQRVRDEERGTLREGSPCGSD